MISKRKRRIYFICFLLCGSSVAIGLSLYSLRENINLYLTPQQLLSEHVSHSQLLRLGGMVVKGSVNYVPHTLQVSFTLTDFKKNIRVQYEGLLPSLFKEGQGIVAQGHLAANGIFIASEVLAKHDENYRPPGMPK